jgi:hypothetical protein
MPSDWSELKSRKRKLSEKFRADANARLITPIVPLPDHTELSLEEWIKHQVNAEPYWFQKIEVLPGFYSPGWSDPAVEKLPYFGLPQDLSHWLYRP